MPERLARHPRDHKCGFLTRTLIVWLDKNSLPSSWTRVWCDSNVESDNGKECWLYLWLWHQARSTNPAITGAKRTSQSLQQARSAVMWAARLKSDDVCTWVQGSGSRGSLFLLQITLIYGSVHTSHITTEINNCVHSPQQQPRPHSAQVLAFPNCGRLKGSVRLWFGLQQNRAKGIRVMPDFRAVTATGEFQVTHTQTWYTANCGLNFRIHISLGSIDPNCQPPVVQPSPENQETCTKLKRQDKGFATDLFRICIAGCTTSRHLLSLMCPIQLTGCDGRHHPRTPPPVNQTKGTIEAFPQPASLCWCDSGAGRRNHIYAS